MNISKEFTDYPDIITSTPGGPSNVFESLRNRLAIVIGMIVGTIVLVIVTIFICRHCRKKRPKPKLKKRNVVKETIRQPIVENIELGEVDERQQKKQLKKVAKKNAKCTYMRLAREYRDLLGWNPNLFDASQDKCYCHGCYSEDKPDVVQAAGASYVIPRGWVRLGLYIDAALETSQNIWDEWIVTFHGTSTTAAQSILQTRQFCLPGDVLIDGTRLGIRPGHIPDKRHIYTSPSISYSSLPVYSSAYAFHSSITNEDHEAQIALQCRQKPGTFKVQGETIGAKSQRICSFIPNEKIEYFTEARAALVAYGLLIKIV